MINGNGNINRMLWWVIGVLGTIVVAGGGSAYSYTHARIEGNEGRMAVIDAVNDRQNERLAITETQYNEIIRRIGGLESKVDDLAKEIRNGNN
jgi:hypothetical protein